MVKAGKQWRHEGAGALGVVNPKIYINNFINKCSSRTPYYHYRAIRNNILLTYIVSVCCSKISKIGTEFVSLQ